MLFFTWIKKEQQYKTYTVVVWSQKFNDKTLKWRDTPGCNSTSYRGLLCSFQEIILPLRFYPFFLPFFLLQCLSVLTNLSSFTCCCLCPPFLPHITGLFHWPSLFHFFNLLSLIPPYLPFLGCYLEDYSRSQEKPRAKENYPDFHIHKSPWREKKPSYIENLLCSGSPKVWVYCMQMAPSELYQTPKKCRPTI